MEGKERIGETEINDDLFEFSPFQVLLIKSRLFLYREGQSVGRDKYAWARIASEISNLPQAPYLVGEEGKRFADRYRHYLLKETRRGPSAKLTPQDIEEANFSISDDTLQRWFEGQTSRDPDEGKKPYQPSAQKIA